MEICPLGENLIVFVVKPLGGYDVDLVIHSIVTGASRTCIFGNGHFSFGGPGYNLNWCGTA